MVGGKRRRRRREIIISGGSSNTCGNTQEVERRRKRKKTQGRKRERRMLKKPRMDAPRMDARDLAQVSLRSEASVSSKALDDEKKEHRHRITTELARLKKIKAVNWDRRTLIKAGMTWGLLLSKDTHLMISEMFLTLPDDTFKVELTTNVMKWFDDQLL